MASTTSTQTSPMSAWLIGLFFGAIDSILLFELGFVGLLFTLAFVGLVAWKGPRLPAAAGLVTGIGLVWTILFANVMSGCAAANLGSGAGCDLTGIGPWVAAAAGVLLIGVAGTVVAARRLRAR
jgi:hypothetical protein